MTDLPCDLGILSKALHHGFQLSKWTLKIPSSDSWCLGSLAGSVSLTVGACGDERGIPGYTAKELEA